MLTEEGEREGRVRKSQQRMCIPKVNFPPLFRDNLELAFTNQGVSNTSLQLQIPLPSPSPLHTHNTQVKMSLSSQLFQTFHLISTVNKLLCLRLAFHKLSQIPGFCKGCSQWGPKKAYLLTHYVDDFFFFVLGILLEHRVCSTRDDI